MSTGAHLTTKLSFPWDILSLGHLHVSVCSLVKTTRMKTHQTFKFRRIHYSQIHWTVTGECKLLGLFVCQMIPLGKRVVAARHYNHRDPQTCFIT